MATIGCASAERRSRQFSLLKYCIYQNLLRAVDLRTGVQWLVGEVGEVQAFRFRALVALRGEGPGQAGQQYISPTHALMLCAARLIQPSQQRFFSAKIAWDDQQPLKPGDRAVVTITLTDEDAEMFFAAGQRFTVWNGHEIGYGTISRQIFTPAAG